MVATTSSAGTDRVHPDVMCSELDGSGLGEIHHGCLRRRVGLRTRTPAQTRHRGGVEDHPAVTLRDHHPGCVLGAEEHRSDQHREAGVPVLHLDLGDRAERATDPGVVEQHVETSERLHCEVHQRRHVLLHRHVGAGEPHPITVTVGREPLGDRTTVVGVEVADHHRRPLLQEPLHGREPHSARPAGDHRRLAVEPSCHVTLPFAGATTILAHP
jgi:hypothetical protein